MLWANISALGRMLRTSQVHREMQPAAEVLVEKRTVVPQFKILFSLLASACHASVAKFVVG